jgi:hypothetical protein
MCYLKEWAIIGCAFALAAGVARADIVSYQLGDRTGEDRQSKPW